MSVVRLEPGDCREVVKGMLDNSIDSCVTDPPYSLVSIQKRFGKPDQAPVKIKIIPGQSGSPYERGARGFMGKQWDTGEVAHDPAFWAEVYRVLKPGAHLVAFGGTRTYHRMVCAIEDAGFEIRDTIAWLYGTGFPKSHNVSKAIDRAAGAEREVVAEGPTVRRIRPGADQGKDGTWEKLDDRTYTHSQTAPATDAAAQWDGWGSALKPAFEPIVLARKPLSEGNIAANVLRWGTGAINIDGCRIETSELGTPKFENGRADRTQWRMAGATSGNGPISNLGRWPANVCHDGSDEVLAAFPAESISGKSCVKRATGSDENGNTSSAFGKESRPAGTQMIAHGDRGSASRFFFSAKAGREDRWGSKHPTVKPVELIRWLMRLVTPPGGTTLDPFAGSGTAGVAALAEGFDAILIEREEEYLEDIRERLAFYSGAGRHSVSSKSRRVAPSKAAGEDTPLFAVEASPAPPPETAQQQCDTSDIVLAGS